MNSLNSTISAKHIYTILNTNRHDMKDYVMRVFNINNNAELNKSLDDNTFNLSDLSNKNTENVTFSLVLSNDVWKTIKPTKRMYIVIVNMYYCNVENGLIFAFKIWEQKKFHVHLPLNMQKFSRVLSLNITHVL